MPLVIMPRARRW